MVEVIANSSRMIIWSASLQLIVLFAGRELLGQKRSLLPAYIFGILKTAVLVLWRESLSLQSEPEIQTIIIQMIITYWSNVISFALFVWTFADTIAKRLAGTILAESYSIIIGDIALIIEGTILGYKNLIDVRTRFVPADLMLPVLCIGVWTILRPIIDRVLRLYRRLKFKHEGLITTAILIFFIFLQTADTVGMLAENRIRYNYVLEMYTVVMFLAVVLCAVIIRNEEQVARMHNTLLMRQLKIITYQYSLMQNKYHKTKYLWKTVSKQMEQLEKKMQSDGCLEDDEVSRYTAELKEEYKRISDRFFCQDAQIDAVLCYEKEALASKQIDAQFSLDHYVPGRVSSEDIAILLYTICEEFANQAAATEEKNLLFHLHCGTISGQLIIKFDKPVQRKWNKTRKRILKETVRKNAGILRLAERNDRQNGCMIRIPNEPSRKKISIKQGNNISVKET